LLSPGRLLNKSDAKAPDLPANQEQAMSLDQIVDGLSEVSCDVLVIGGGTAGPMAALKAKLKSCSKRPTSSAPERSRWAWTA
jgi:hypothetical protein